MSSVTEAIDVHGHYGVPTDQKWPRLNRFMSGSAADVIRRALSVRVGITVVSPLAGLMIRSPEGVLRANRQAARLAAKHPELRFWAVLDPRNPRSFSQVRELLGHPRCVGIKIHPEMHQYPIREQGRAVFGFAEAYGAVVLTHSGEERSLPADFVPLANAFPGVRVILAHLGFGADGSPEHQVRAMAKSRQGNLFTDTSSSLSIMPNLIEWAVHEVGADRVLFGSDTPLYFVANQRARIDQADLSAADKRLILRLNAERLLGHPGRDRH
jgi:predicted TIM-barrel fold metal-dependent hydrolase